MAFCLPKEFVDKFIQGLKNGEINPDILYEIKNSAERQKFLEKYVGKENAEGVNTLLESKFLLKNWQQGVITWAKNVSGIKEKTRNDIISKVKRMEKVLDTAEEDLFLNDLVNKKLGATVTREETQEITRLANNIAEKETYNPKTFEFPSEEDRLAYGLARVELDNFVNDLKGREAIVTLKDIKHNPLGSLKESVIDLGGMTKALKASIDNSVIFRQGWKTMFTHPKIWAKNSLKTFSDMAKTFGGKETLDMVKAEILSRPNSLNGKYLSDKLAVGVLEEAFPTSLPAKIPYLGKVFKASEAAFTGFQYRTRADIFDKLTTIAEKTGADTEGIGRIANSLTGRGALGKLEPIGGTLNNVFFSPRLVASNIDALTGHGFGLSKNLSTFAKKQAAINTIKIIGGIASILAIAKAMDKDSVDFDPRSANFGKIKVGDTRFDVSGGMAGLATLASRVIAQSSKSSTTNKITELNTGKFGSPTIADILINFTGNKLSPLFAIFNDVFIRGTDFQGNKPTFEGEAANLLVPLPITNAKELASNPNAANIIVAMLADALGIGTNTYAVNKKSKGGITIPKTTLPKIVVPKVKKQ